MGVNNLQRIVGFPELGKYKIKDMKKILIILFFIIACNVYGQLPQDIIENTVSVNTDENYSSIWMVHTTPYEVIFRNNLLTFQASSKYILQVGRDAWNTSYNNNMDGAVVSGNKFVWTGYPYYPGSVLHTVMCGYNKNYVLKYNYHDGSPYPFVIKGGYNSVPEVWTTGGVFYNIFKDIRQLTIKGVNNVRLYNNTWYDTRHNTDESAFILIAYNLDPDQTLPYPGGSGTKIKNNIFYQRVNNPVVYMIGRDSVLKNFECDYNVYWCENSTNNEPRFQVDLQYYSWSEWRALGYDTHSVIRNPNFINTTDFVPAARLDYGTNLGSYFEKGLAVNAIWGSGNPANSTQNGTWQVGARIYETSSTIRVTGITVTGAGGATTITTDNGTLQLSAAVLPSNATNQTVTWSVSNGTGQATINSTGLVTAVANGTVTARATANDGSGVSGTLVITISNQVIPVTGITVTGAGGATTITTDNGTLQLSAAVLPSNATNQTVTWSVSNGTGQATINSTGLVTAVANGTVTARATANDGSGVSGTLVITISNQVIPVTGITVTGAGGATTITTDNGTLQLSAAVTPDNATNKAITWSVSNGTGQATINSTGLITAVANGTVTARATANDGSGVSGTLVITISNQVIPVTGITVTGAGGATTITTDNGTLQLSAAVLPSNATNQTVTWSVSNGTGQATINSTGLVTAVANGTVTARATANDGSGVSGTLIITISNQVIPVTGITVTGAGGATLITSIGGTLQLSAAVLLRIMQPIRQ